jgi:transcriptional regulator with XRE-family HTH domain
MKWFDEHKELVAGSDDEAPGSSYRAIAKIADETLSEKDMVQFVRDAFPSQKAFGEFLGVGESTVAGWMKSGSFPDYSKRATLAAYYSNKYFRQLKDAKRDATRPKVIKDGDRYSIVRFKVDEVGVSIGEVLARDIPTKKAALVFAGGIRAWELLGETEHLIDHELESMDPEDSAWIQDLKDEIGSERARIFAHDTLLERERERTETIKDLNLDDLLTMEPTAKAVDVEQAKENGDA